MEGAIVKQHILITGANGFIGRGLCSALKEKGYSVRAAARNNARDIPGVDEYVQVGDIDESTDWRQALDGADTVIHLAARVHVMDSRPSTSLRACFRGNDRRGGNDKLCVFRKVNALGTARLARMAAEARVKRFIFVSSVKVNGEGSKAAYTEKDVPAPQDAYGVSKREAEDSLACIAAETGLQTVVLRLPLVYGPGVKANFKNLIKLAGLGLPLPLKNIDNKRSFIYLGNLVDAIALCITHPKAAGETFMVSDCADVSTPDLIKMIKKVTVTKGDSHLFYLHPGILKTLCKIVGKSEELEKLTGTLIVDSSKIRNTLGWKPPFTIEEGIRETVRFPLSQK